MAKEIIRGPVDCACVIHGTAYDWIYVDRLYSMLSRHITPGINLHVYTEADRPVPAPYIKHALLDWSISGPRRGWWYKMQMFNPEHHAGPLLYFDLDTVIVRDIDWMWKQTTSYFWAIHDFKHLWRPSHVGINSSVMWWDTQQYRHVWDTFVQQNLQQVMTKYQGDQDYITDIIPQNQRRFFDASRIQSWRWQCLDGGYDFRRRRYHNPGQGTKINENTSVLVFHGNPKPADITENIIMDHWR